MEAKFNGVKIGVHIDSPALGDTIAAIPAIWKIYQAYGHKKISVFSSRPELFFEHPIIDETIHYDHLPLEGYKIYRTFGNILGKKHNIDGDEREFRYSNMDIRQFHAVSLGFTLLPEEMETDLYIERKPDRVDEFPDKYYMVHPVNSWPTRTWGTEKWQELINILNDNGVPVIAVGRDSSEVGAFDVNKDVNRIEVKYGMNLLNDPKNDVAELRWLMNNVVDGVITMDSGLLHVAGTTSVNIIQIGSSINYRLRAPYRNGKQTFRYTYVPGKCKEFCSSNMAYNVLEHGDINGIPPQVSCLMGKPEFECHPTPSEVANVIFEKQISSFF